MKHRYDNLTKFYQRWSGGIFPLNFILVKLVVADMLLHVDDKMFHVRPACIMQTFLHFRYDLFTVPLSLQDSASWMAALKLVLRWTLSDSKRSEILKWFKAVFKNSVCYMSQL